MNVTDTTQARNRKDATIDVAICTDCFCSVPADQLETHREWHVGRTTEAVSR
ncbi:MAG: hypothetical protein MUP76_04625 [Acidimicrobiia bacterium]|nr:hypothetical protein [Acidimicrobiia bacterium]